MGSAHDEQIERLEPRVREDAGAAEFPALAEWLRRAGRLAEAERVAQEGLEARPDSAAGRAVLLLVLQDAGRSEEARRCLESWADEAVALDLAHVPARDEGPEVSDTELEHAFAAAEPDVDAMITPDTVAEEAALFVDGEPEGAGPLETGDAFATHTMADLLERQGDIRGAERIRASLSTPALSPAPGDPGADTDTPDPGQLVAALERWLDNARRMRS